MSRKFVIPLLTAVFIAAPAFAPATMTSLFGSAQAEKAPTSNSTNLNSSRSNNYRTINTTKSNTFRTKTGGSHQGDVIIRKKTGSGAKSKHDTAMPAIQNTR